MGYRTTEKYKETEIGPIPEEWEVLSIGELIESGYVKNENNRRSPLSSAERSRISGEYPYYGAASAIDSINEYRFDGYYLLIAEDGTVYDGNGPMLQLVDGKFWVSNHAHVLQGRNPQVTKLLYYLLKNVDIAPYVTGAVQPKLSKQNLYKVRLALPSRDIEREKIVELLGSLDEKIELNRKMNKTLEEIAQALFKRWFVDFEFPADSASRNQAGEPIEPGKPYKSSGGKMIDSDLGPIPEEWRVGMLGEFINLRGGLAYDGSRISTTGNPMINMGFVSGEKRYEYGGIKYYEGKYKHQCLVRPGDLVVATRDVTQDRRLIGSPSIIPDLFGSTEIIAATNLYIVDNFSNIPNQYIYWILRSPEYRERVIGSCKGSTIVMITKDSILGYRFAVSSPKITEKFSEINLAIFDQLDCLDKQNLRLVTLRDSLLPRLMSGKIRTD